MTDLDICMRAEIYRRIFPMEAWLASWQHTANKFSCQYLQVAFEMLQIQVALPTLPLRRTDLNQV